MNPMNHQPWELVQNQIRGRGGREIDKFRGVENGKGDYNAGSEAWIGSTTHVENAKPENPYYGCAEVIHPDGRKMYLFEAINEAPEEILGAKHMAINGTGIGVLVKYLDAQYQYGLQCHPTREMARKYWNQEHGKAESWYVIGTRDDVDEPPYMILGFKDGVTREVWEKYYNEGNLEKLEGLCHKFEVKTGDAFFLGGGLPHALGQGCFVIEVQEPQDITLGWQNYDLVRQWYAKWGLSQEEIDKRFMSKEQYDARLLDSYIYDGCTLEENFRRWKSEKPVIRSGEWGDERFIIGPTQTNYFACTEITVKGETEILHTGSPQIGIALSGTGKLVWDGGEMELKQGKEIFFPVDISGLKVVGDLHLVLCHPEGAYT